MGESFVTAYVSGCEIDHRSDRQPDRALTDSQREVFVLRELEELDTQEFCKILGRTVTHVGVLFHLARGCGNAWKVRGGRSRHDEV